jgi:hypothetical protein
MNKGTVKWFNNQKGFGFAVERAGMSTLNERAEGLLRRHDAPWVRPAGARQSRSAACLAFND